MRLEKPGTVYLTLTDLGSVWFKGLLRILYPVSHAAMTTTALRMIIQLQKNISFPLEVLSAAIAYAAFEAIIIQSYLRSINDFSRPVIGGMLYPYHVFVMFPTIIMLSYLIAHLNCRGKTLQIVLLQTFQIVPIFVALEDFLYFLIQKNVILSTDWTCQIIGCLKLVGIDIPIWYFISIAMTFLATILTRKFFSVY